MSNPFTNRAISLSGPATDLVPITPSDVQDLGDVAVSLYVETGGIVSFISVMGQSRSVALYDGALLPVGVRRVNATGTTATGIHAFVVN